jgi:hypothetical protein
MSASRAHPPILTFALFKGAPGSYNKARRIEFTMPCLLLQELALLEARSFLVRSPYAAARLQIIGLSDATSSSLERLLLDEINLRCK